MAPWPPQLEDLKVDLKIAPSDTRDDVLLQTDLDAAVAYVERERRGDFNFLGVTTGTLATKPLPNSDVRMGTVRLAGRWSARRRSPDGLIDAGNEFGTSRIPRDDTDIQRQLGIGPFRDPMV